ncbi:LysM peptidoglycan-binding domain-containing protein [Companilactobacillus sp. DQM5]|uniref:LysM peptidoglycan-binding domain-containing protein n=1 Tax=Companilactobacillus sp. DQM5 TaxID=3463359 RepID=UPI004057D6F1
MLTRKQIRKMKHNNKAKKAITTSALALGVGLGLTAISSNKVDAATWTANSVESIQSALKTSGTTPYTIKWGDTLSTIAEAANKNGINTSVARLTEINKIANADLIYAGNKLWFNASNETVTGKDTNGNNHTYNLNPNKPVTDNNSGTKTPAKPATPTSPKNNGSTGNNTGSNNGNNNGKVTPPNNGGSNNNGGGSNTNPGGNDNGNNGGNVTPPDNGGDNNNGGNTNPPTNNIYTPNAEAIKADFMSLVNMSANGKYWGIPTGKAPSGADWTFTSQHLSASGNMDEYTSDMGVAKELYSTFIQDNLTDPSYVSAYISNLTVTGSVDKTTHKGMITVSDMTIQWYGDPFYGLDVNN